MRLLIFNLAKTLGLCLLFIATVGGVIAQETLSFSPDVNGEHVDLFSTSDGQLILVTSTGTYRLVKEEIFLVNATGDRKIHPPQQSYHDKKSPRRYPLNDGTFISVETDGDFILNETNRPAIHLKLSLIHI